MNASFILAIGPSVFAETESVVATAPAFENSLGWKGLLEPKEAFREGDDDRSGVIEDVAYFFHRSGKGEIRVNLVTPEKNGSPLWWSRPMRGLRRGPRR